MDVKLHPELFARVDAQLGGVRGFDIDLMALPLNVQTGRDGRKLEFFSPYQVPGAEGINALAQNIKDRNAYIFLAYVMIEVVLKFIWEQSER